jgi:hypothetical protein
MKMEEPKDVREFIKEFIVKVGSGEMEGVKSPGVIIQALNCWLKCWELEQDTEIERRLIAIENKIQEGGFHERQREREFN